MTKQIYIFNPEHDLYIANGDENFVLPRSAVGFAKENMDLSEHLRRHLDIISPDNLEQ